MTDLLSGKCIPCEKGTLPLTEDEVLDYMGELKDWTYVPEFQKITKEYKFKDFAQAMNFANKIAAVAEDQGHHPDLMISWGKVTVELTTHAIKGLSRNDFIVAAVIDGLNRYML